MNFWLKPQGAAPRQSVGGVASGFDIIGAAAESMRLVDNSTAATDALTEGYEEWRRLYKAGTGQDAPPNPMIPAPADFSNEDPRMRAMGLVSAVEVESRTIEEQRTAFSQFINDQATRLPAEAVRSWAQFDPGQHALQLAREADTELAQMMESRPGWDKYVAAFTGAAAGSLRDPIQLGTLAIGGGPGAARTVIGRILATAASEAAVNAATEAALQPIVQDWRAKAGLDSGLDVALTNIAFAGALGGLFGAGGRGFAEVLNRAPSGAAARAALPPELRGALDAADMLAMTNAQRPEAVSAPVFDQLTARADALAQRQELPPQPAVRDELQVSRIVDALAPTGEAPIVPSSMASTLDFIRTGDAPDAAPSRPVLRFVSSIGGVDPNSPIGAELRAAGISSRDMPGIYRNGGRQALDNIPIGEAAAAFPGRTDLADGNGYVSQQVFIDSMTGEVARRGEASNAAAEARVHYERRGVDFDQADDVVMSRMAEIDDADRRYFAQGESARTETADLVRRALERAGGPVPDAVIRAAVDLAREGEDLATAVDWAMSDAAGVSRSLPARESDFDYGATPPEPDGVDNPGALDVDDMDWAADLDALRELDPDLADQLEAEYGAAIDNSSTLQRVVDACPF